MRCGRAALYRPSHGRQRSAIHAERHAGQTRLRGAERHSCILKHVETELTPARDGESGNGPPDAEGEARITRTPLAWCG